MAHFMNRPRTVETWLAIRRELADYLEAHVQDPMWATIGATCQEAQNADEMGIQGGLGSQLRLSFPASAMSGLPIPRVIPLVRDVTAALPTLALTEASLHHRPERAQCSDASSDELCDEVRSVQQADDGTLALAPATIVSCTAVLCAGTALGSGDPTVVSAKVEGIPQVIVASALPARLVSGPERFRVWVKGLAPEVLNDVSSSFEAWKQAELVYLKSIGKKLAPSELTPRLRFPATKLTTRLAQGAAYAKWLDSPSGKASKEKKHQLRDYLKATRSDCQHMVHKKDRMWLSRCHKTWLDHEAHNKGLGACLPRSRKPTIARSRLPEHLLSRTRGRQGQPFKCPQLGDLLWQWFVDIRASVASKLSPKIVMCKAKELAAKLLAAMRASGCYSAIPDISRMWFLRWKRNHGVVLRKPNARFKCSRDTLKLRLRAMWLNLIRVRHLASRLLGNDLSLRIWGIDEKPLHFNEGGSKCIGTLEIAGAKEVRLKENHAATRQRVSLMTSVTSDPMVARSFANMPLEILFKAKTDWKCRGLRPEPGMKFSFAWSDKGSYRGEHILQYLRLWLDPWTELRAAKGDWRILLLDEARSHCGDEVVALCHERGYCCLYHYGCTTGVAQVNDTDLHAEFSAVYIDFEQQAFHDQQLNDPGDISRNLKEVHRDASATWMRCDHTKGARGHLSNGLNNKLDGSQDHLVTRDAGVFWRECDMALAREAAIVEVDAMLASADIPEAFADRVELFAGWQKLIQHPPGHLGVTSGDGDGAEFEGELEPGEMPWLTEEDKAAILQDDIRVLTDDLKAAKSLPDDVDLEVKNSLSSAARLARLRVLRAGALDLRVPASVGLLDAEIKQVDRGLHAGGHSESKEAQAIVRAFVAGSEEKELRLYRKRRYAAYRLRKVQRRAKASASKLRARLAKAKKVKAELKAKRKALPAQFMVKTMSLSTPQGQKEREECLERLKLHSPPLSFEQDANWPRIRKSWCCIRNLKQPDRLGWKEGKKPEFIGIHFRQLVDTTMKELGTAFNGKSTYKDKFPKVQDPEAFLRVFRRMQRDVQPLALSFIEI